MLTLHYAPDNASMIVRLVLEELGLPYRTTLVDRSTRQQDSPAYRRLNPAGLIPVLETPDGALFETGAILLWLADRHGAGRIAPTVDSPQRGDFLKWLFFLSNTAHADLRQVFYPENYVPPEAVPGHHALLSARMRRHFTLLDGAVAKHSELFAPDSVLSSYLCALIRWSVLYPRDQQCWFRLKDYPAIATLAVQAETLPPALSVARAEGLGNTPFSAPDYPNPPEGTVT